MPIANLTGFDLVWAITQNTVNSQLNWLMHEHIPRHIKMGDLETDGMVIGGAVGSDDEARLALPTPSMPMVDFDTGQAKLARLYLNLDRGTITTWSGFGKSAREIKFNVSGTRIAFKVNMNLGQVAHEELGRPGGVIPPEIAKILQQFDSSMFSIKSIFLDFQNSDLTTYDEVNSNLVFIPLSGGDAAAMDFIKANFGKMMGAWISQFRGKENPFILGYPVARQARSEDVKAVLQPTGANLSTHSWQYEGASHDHQMDGLSTLNFLLVTGGKKILDDPKYYAPDAGVFHRNLVTSNDIDGKGIIARELFLGTYLQQNLIDPFLLKLKDLGDYRNARMDKAGDDRRLTVDESTHGFVPTLTGWHYNDHVVVHWEEDGNFIHWRDSEQNTMFDIVMSMEPDRDPAMLGALRLTLTIAAQLYRRETDETRQRWPGLPSTYYGKGWADARLKWNIWLQFIAGTDGKVDVKFSQHIDEPVKNHGIDGIFEFADFFSNAFGTHTISQDWDTNADSMVSEDNGIASRVMDATEAVLGNMALLVVLPAPSQFFYKNILLNADGDIEVDLAYKTQE